MRKRLLASAAAAGLALAGLSIVVGTPVAEACGGNYVVTVEADTGQGITYCSDGTIAGVRDVTAPGDSKANCGGNYPVNVGAGPVDDPTSASSYTYCSDGTFEDLGVPATGGTSCGGDYPVAVGADTGQGVTYCSDGTLEGVHNLTAPAGEEPGDCGGKYPVTVEIASIDDPTSASSYSYCSDGTFEGIEDLLS